MSSLRVATDINPLVPRSLRLSEFTNDVLNDRWKLNVAIVASMVRYFCCWYIIFIPSSELSIGYFKLLRNLFSLSITSSAAASNDDSNDAVFVNVLMNFPELMLSVLDVTTT